MIRARVRVRGRVQGVLFRAEAQARARSLGVSGWVRNAADGTVETVFEGESEQVRSMIEWCRRGPPGASVDGVDVAYEEPSGESGFRVL
jgi:acylphosphatase